MSKLVKIRFLLEQGHWSGAEAEWMWAERISGDRFALDNSPFDAYGVSYRDVVAASRQDGALTFSHILEKAGHRTIRVRLPSTSTHADFMTHWPLLDRLGCTFEGSQNGQPQYAIDVPPGVAISEVLEYAAKLEAGGAWEYEEADV